MPMSLSEIEADKDLLRASYAIQIRKLETSLEKAREKIASQTIELSKLQMEISGQKEQISGMQRNLDERSNAANVFEKTITKRFPELDSQLHAAQDALEARSKEIKDLKNKLARKEEAVALAQQAASEHQTEIRQLQDALENRASKQAGRHKKSSTNWSAEDYKAECDRLNLDLSKLREELSVAQKRESQQATVLKTEMQQLAQQIMTVANQEEREETPSSPFSDQGQATKKTSEPESSLAAPRPWPGQTSPKNEPLQNDTSLPSSSQKIDLRSDNETASA
jgi:chromosome segregation ATPase